MAETITMPKLGFDMAEGTLVRWVKQEGEQINKGDVLAEIETDKATVEVESHASGVVLRLLVNQGDVVPVSRPKPSSEGRREIEEAIAAQPAGESYGGASRRGSRAGGRAEGRPGDAEGRGRERRSAEATSDCFWCRCDCRRHETSHARIRTGPREGIATGKEDGRGEEYQSCPRGGDRPRRARRAPGHRGGIGGPCPGGRGCLPYALSRGDPDAELRDRLA
jgi:pyruvate/2-oxoglutarate dehydrogenase complex dihydrolipoamide acyltransferase (E2) component